MFSIKRDFGMLGRLFGVPRAWLSRVGSFCSSWSASGGIITLDIPTFPDPSRNPIKVGIDDEALNKRIDERVSGEMGDDPLDNTGAGDLADSDIELSGVSDWESGGPNGSRLQVFVAGIDDFGAHHLYPAHIDFSKNGTVKSIKFLKNKSFDL